MNHLKLKSAVKKYAHLAEGEKIDALNTIIAEGLYSEEEATKIAESLYEDIDGKDSEDGDGDGDGEVKGSDAVPGDTEDKFALKTFEVWKAEPVFKYRISEDTGDKERYLHSIKKKGEKPLSETIIEQRHADELNSHAENSKLYYFPKK